MTASEQHPHIAVFVRRSPGRYRRKSAPDQAQVSDGSVVRVDVGMGLRAEDLPRTVAFAHRIRNARRLEILGRTPRAVEEARKTFLAAWTIEGAPVAAAGSPAVSWAALMLAQSRTAGEVGRE